MAPTKESLALLKGLISYIPGSNFLVKMRGTKSPRDASYFYGVWLKHLSILSNSGTMTPPCTVAELGPGDTLGVGIAALLSGAHTYVALDVIKYTSVEKNMQLLDDMVALFRNRAPRPDKGWPDFDRFLDESLFPGKMLTNEAMEKNLAPDRIEQIRCAIRGENTNSNPIQIRYLVPWTERLQDESVAVDFCLSHSVLQYVDNLENLFRELRRLLVDGGVMSHQIDLTGHNTSDIWNGHLGFSERSWSIIRGNRPYFLNREPYSTYVSAIKKQDFEIIFDLKQTQHGGLVRGQLSKKWSHLTEQDLTCSGAFIQARK